MKRGEGKTYRGRARKEELKLSEQTLEKINIICGQILFSRIPVFYKECLRLFSTQTVNENPQRVPLLPTGSAYGLLAPQTD